MRSLPEFPLPKSDDPQSLQSYLSSEWLKLAEHFGDVKDASIRAHDQYVEEQAANMNSRGIGSKLKDLEQGFEEGVNEGVGKVKDTLNNGAQKIKGSSKNGLETLRDSEKKIQDSVANGVKNGMDKLKEGEQKAEDIAKTGMRKLEDGEKKFEDIVKDGVGKVRDTVAGGKKQKQREKSRRADKSIDGDKLSDPEESMKSRKPKRGENSKDGADEDTADCGTRRCREKRRAARSKSKRGDDSSAGSRGFGAKTKEGEPTEPRTVITSGPQIIEDADTHGLSRFVIQADPKVSISKSHMGHFDWKTGEWSLTNSTTISKEWRRSNRCIQGRAICHQSSSSS